MSSTSISTHPLQQQRTPSYGSIVPSCSRAWSSGPLYEVEGVKLADKSRYITIAHATHAMRQELYVNVVKAASNCRVSVNDMEDLMLAGARILDTEITLLRMRGVITCLVGSRITGWEMKIKYQHAAHDGAYREDGLHAVHTTLDAVAAETTTIAEAMDDLNDVIEEQDFDLPIQHPMIQLCVAAALSIAVFAILNHGSLHGADIAALGTILVSIAHIILYCQSSSHSRMLEMPATILASLVIHDARVPNVATMMLASILAGYLYTCSIVKNSESLALTLARAGFWTVYAIALGSGLPVLLDFALMYRLLTLVVRFHDLIASRTSSSRDTSKRPGMPVIEKAQTLHV